MKKTESINLAYLALSFEQTAIDVAANSSKKLNTTSPGFESNLLVHFLTAIASVDPEHVKAAPHSSPGCTLTWPCLPAPER